MNRDEPMRTSELSYNVASSALREAALQSAPFWPGGHFTANYRCNFIIYHTYPDFSYVGSFWI